MQAAPIPPNEIDRIRALRECCVLDTGPDSAFDDLTRLAAYLCDTPMALVSLVDDKRQWFKSSYGIMATETPRSVAFCGHAILTLDPLVVADATKDPRFQDNPLVTGEPNVRFYAGMPLLTSDGLALGTLCVIDIKPREISEHQLEQLAALARQASTQLELRRTAQRLSNMRVAAEAANKAKSEFLANMSHEVRTPLTALLGFVELLKDDAHILNAPEHVKEFIATIQQSGNELLQILNDVLDLARIEAGKLDVEQITFPFEPFLTRIVSFWRSRAASKGLGFEVSVDPSVPEKLESDPHRLRQILVNLLSNAVKFTSSGTIRLEVSRVGRSMPGVRFDVVDTGIGIDENNLLRMFEPFSQADFSITRQFGGTGLGLTICKRLAEMLEGNVSIVESFLGKGTRFRLEVNAVPSSQVHQDEDPAPERAGMLDGVRILLIEDNEYNCKLFSLMLRQAAATVDIQPNGKAGSDVALDALARGNPYDVILMDIQMPIMDGLTATRLLRERGYEGPIVAVTANAMAQDRDRCLEAGCNEYISKPVTGDRLLSVCLSVLREPAAAC